MLTPEQRKIAVIIGGQFSNTPSDEHAYQVVTALEKEGYLIVEKQMVDKFVAANAALCEEVMALYEESKKR